MWVIPNSFDTALPQSGGSKKFDVSLCRASIVPPAVSSSCARRCLDDNDPTYVFVTKSY